MSGELKPAKSIESIFALLAGVPTKAYRIGLKSKRTYQSSYGAWNADLVDHIFKEVQRFLDQGNLSPADAALLSWNRALQNWELSRFEEAIADASLALNGYGEGADRRINENIQRSIALMKERRLPSALIDQSSLAE